MNQLEQLKQYTTVVADTGDFESMRQYAPRDATTNPSLILQAVQKPAYAAILERVVKGRGAGGLTDEARVRDLVDHLIVAFGQEILRILPGRVSTEVDARLSFDVAGSIDRARRLIALYAEKGIERERVLIKLASTWEGIRAAEVLQREGIQCNMTLLFSLPQAAACADAGARLISPFVGRIYDWYKAHEKREYAGAEDPGVRSVTQIYEYYKQHGFQTEVMGASFRNKGQITELAGCDLLTISPELLGQLAESSEAVTRKLSPDKAMVRKIPRLSLDEKTFRYLLNDDAMACEKTAEGIRRFAADIVALEKLITRALAG